MSESQWVQRRRRLVEDFVQGRTLLPALLGDSKLAGDTFLALRDEIKTLREHLTPTRRDDDGDPG
jgi:hypothetical protein